MKLAFVKVIPFSLYIDKIFLIRIVDKVCRKRDIYTLSILVLSKMNKKICIGLLCLSLIVSSSGCLENSGGKEVTMTMDQVIKDNYQHEDNITRKYTSGFDSLKHGDVLIILDVLDNITYLFDEYQTKVKFTSSNQLISIEGDITNEFSKGDLVKVTLHIIRVLFSKEDPYTGEFWTFELETFEEGWNSDSDTIIPLPNSVISHV
jgi:hypothetical protein